MSYTKKKTRKSARFNFKPRPDVVKAKAPKTMSPLLVNAALATFAIVGLAMALTA